MRLGGASTVGKRDKVVVGTYIIKVPPTCVVMGDGWTLTGLIEWVGHVSVTAPRVTTPAVLNITDNISSHKSKLLTP